jgi:hypothetical protein
VSRRAFVSTAAAFGAVAVTGLTACHTRTPDHAIIPDHAVTYAFADEFNGPEGSVPDPSNWRYNIGGGEQPAADLHLLPAEQLPGRKGQPGDPGHQEHPDLRRADHHQLSQRPAHDPGEIQQIPWHVRGPREARRPARAMARLVGHRRQLPAGGLACLRGGRHAGNYGGSTVQTSVHTPDNARTSVLTRHADIAVDDAWHIWPMW